ncbi:hypothetical protein [Algoriphagus taiwanensis]|uniref:Uncharacterized protein n=1 Tax=Algoriphagus taiwanensis TaxID=1445656 RepID=A0ABQ6PZ42_9BACT|nr:hypothetical protein Ataiwa_07400 [Algoriphagus taiwanensis]
MKNIKILSIIITLVIFTFIILNLTLPLGKNNYIESSYLVREDTVSHILNEIENKIEEEIKYLDFANKQIRDTIIIIDTNYMFSNIEQEFAMYKEKITSNHITPNIDQHFITQKFWIKVIFSGIFCIAALFVILSKKYDDETKKWAFSVLTLIAGVWIGTIS